MHRLRRLCVALVVLLATLSPALADPASDRADLLAGVEAIAAPGVPGPVCVFGPDAFAVVLGRLSTDVVGAVVGASRLGAGRVVAFGHDGYVADANSLAVRDTQRLLANAVSWSARKRRPRVGVRGRAARTQALRGFPIVRLDDARWLERLSEVDALVLEPANLRDDEIGPVRAFVEQGGGLVCASLGWGWLQLNPGGVLADHPGNRLLAPAGLSWGDGYFERTLPEGYAAGAPIPTLVGAPAALDRLSRLTRPADVKQASATLTNALAALAPDDRLLLPHLDRLRAGLREALLPSEAAPLTDPTARVLLALELVRTRGLPAEQVKASPAARLFPGAVEGGARRESVTLRIDLSESGWHGTGLYAPAGEGVRVKVPARATSLGLRVRIGAHTDELWDVDRWKRVPAITLSRPVTRGEFLVASAFGGPIYIEVEKGREGVVEIGIEGGVRAPRFVLDATTDWASSRLAPAPWGELEGRRVILTLPSSVLRTLDDPAPLMRFWDRVADACADLATIPHERDPRQRYVADVQLAMGTMHSGYPIMTHLDAAAMMVDLKRLRSEEAWGLYHEMGHNHQSAPWTFEGTVEVTCNLFTRYVLETLCNLPLSAQKMTGRPQLGAYLAAGTPFPQWKSDPFLALLMYDQLQQAFGWAPFRQVFARYRALPDAERPENDAQKRDRWMTALSRAVGRNLGPFFEAWGVPTTAAARAEVRGLPPWMPREMAPASPRKRPR